MREKKIIAVTGRQLDKINTPRQLANLYLENKLENFFVWNNLHFYRSLERPFKKELDEWEKENAGKIIDLVKKKWLSKKAISLIENIPNKNVLIYFALYDFGLAIHNFLSVMQYVMKHNKTFKSERRKALSYISKLLENYSIMGFEKENLETIKGRLLYTPSERGGNYYPLYFLDFLHDLGWCPGEKVDKSYLQHKLEGIYVALNIRFPRNRRPDDFIFQALQILIYERLSKINGNPEILTADIINAFFKNYKDGLLKHLSKLKSKDIKNTVDRFPANP